MTQAEYLTWESGQEEKHEFVDGYVFPLFGDRTMGFAGGTGWHNQLTVELLLLIAPAARPCRTYSSDLKIEMVSSTRYADVFVTCDERDRNDAVVMRHPKLIVEVLSESTARDDLGTKMYEYRAIDTLVEYLMIDSRKRWAQILHREAGQWTLAEPITSGTLTLASINLTIDIDEIYARTGVSA